MEGEGGEVEGGDEVTAIYYADRQGRTDLNTRLRVDMPERNKLTRLWDPRNIAFPFVTLEFQSFIYMGSQIRKFRKSDVHVFHMKYIHSQKGQDKTRPDQTRPDKDKTRQDKTSDKEKHTGKQTQDIQTTRQTKMYDITQDKPSDNRGPDVRPETRQDKTKQEELMHCVCVCTRQDKTRQHKTRHDNTRHDTTRQDKTRQRQDTDKIRQDKTKQDKTRQVKTRQCVTTHSLQRSERKYTGHQGLRT